MSAPSVRAKLAFAIVSGSIVLCGGIAWGFRVAHATTTDDVTNEAVWRDPASVSATSLDVLPKLPLLDKAKVSLGKRLFHDPSISGDGTVACASCHDIGNGGADGRKFSIGVGGQSGSVNAPTAINAEFNSKQFWDGRASTLEAQIEGPLNNRKEMGATWSVVIRKLDGDPSYQEPFARAYPEGVTRASIKDAIASYERSLVSTNAPFDRYLSGDHAALNSQEIEGYELFKRIGCVSCHQGRNVGGNMFEKIGIMDDYFAARGGPIAEADLGRFNVTHDPKDKFTFRVPSLRLASRTAPYFHDGSIATLEEAIVAMGHYQLGEQLDTHDVAAIKAFIGSLAGKVEDP